MVLYDHHVGIRTSDLFFSSRTYNTTRFSAVRRSSVRSVFCWRLWAAFVDGLPPPVRSIAPSPAHRWTIDLVAPYVVCWAAMDRVCRSPSLPRSRPQLRAAALVLLQQCTRYTVLDDTPSRRLLSIFRNNEHASLVSHVVTCFVRGPGTKSLNKARPWNSGQDGVDADGRRRLGRRGYNARGRLFHRHGVGGVRGMAHGGVVHNGGCVHLGVGTLRVRAIQGNRSWLNHRCLLLCIATCCGHSTCEVRVVVMLMIVAFALHLVLECVEIML